MNTIELIEYYCEFEKVFVDILNKWAHLFKRKFLRVIYAPCMTKRLRKTKMKRSELKSMHLKFKIKIAGKIFVVDSIRRDWKSTLIQ